MNKKPKICKCGHDKQDHYKQPKTKLSIITECQRCKCTDYLRRERPDKFDKLYVIIGFIIFGMLIFSAVQVFPITQVKDETKIPISVLGTILELIFIVLGLKFFQPFFGSYLDAKRRKTYEVEP